MPKPCELIDRPEAPAIDVLDRLAVALGCSTQAFFHSPPQPSISAETHELLSLWLSLTCRRARADILASVREAVAAQSD